MTQAPPTQPAALQRAGEAVKAVAQSIGLTPPDQITPEYAAALRHQLERRRGELLGAMLGDPSKS
jgi:hypothetical protein